MIKFKNLHYIIVSLRQYIFNIIDKLMNLFGTSATANQITRAIGSGESELLPSDKFLNYDRTEGDVIINLPKISDFINAVGGTGNTLNTYILLSDVTPLSSVNTATITCYSGDNVNGSLSAVLSLTGGSNFSLQPTPFGWLLIDKVAQGTTGATGAIGATGTDVELTFRVEASSAQVLEGFSTPIVLVPSPGAGFQIVLLAASLTINFNSLAYQTNLSVSFITDTAGAEQLAIANGLNSTVTRTIQGRANLNYVSSSVGGSVLVADKGLNFKIKIGDPTVGNSDIILSGIYIITQV